MARLVRRPLADASQPRAAATASASSRPPPSPPVAKNWRKVGAGEARAPAPDDMILIVEDNHTAGAALRRAVESHGHRAVLVREAAEGIREAARTPVALALVALGLRHAKDVDLVAELRRLPDPPEIIVMAGRADRASALAAVEAGAGYLVRPVDAARLGPIIRR